jgi:hypothetical protein
MSELAAGDHGRLRRLASVTALDPNTTWVHSSARQTFILTIGLAVPSLLHIG